MKIGQQKVKELRPTFLHVKLRHWKAMHYYLILGSHFGVKRGAHFRVVKNGTSWNYEYYLKDHLGNNRVVVAYTNDTDEYKATMEIASQSTEESQFKNLPVTRLQIVAYNHTPKSYLHVTPAPDRVAETNGYTNKPIGPAKLLQVRTGDQVTTEVYARYVTGTGGSTAVISNLVAALTGAYGIGTGEAAYAAFTNNLPAIAGGLAANTNVPK